MLMLVLLLRVYCRMSPDRRALFDFALLVYKQMEQQQLQEQQQQQQTRGSDGDHDDSEGGGATEVAEDDDFVHVSLQQALATSARGASGQGCLGANSCSRLHDCNQLSVYLWKCVRQYHGLVGVASCRCVTVQW